MQRHKYARTPPMEHTPSGQEVAPVKRQTRKNLLDLLRAVIIAICMVVLGVLLLARALGW